MKTDLSKSLYEKYFDLTMRTVTVILKNQKIIIGVFISFCLGDQYSFEPFITKWHIVNEADKNTLGIDSFGFLIGECINQNDISEILFHENNSVMKFY